MYNLIWSQLESGNDLILGYFIPILYKQKEYCINLIIVCFIFYEYNINQHIFILSRSDVEATGLRLKAPPEPGKWSLGALSVSQAMGLRFSYPIVITVFQPIDVEFHLPAGFRAGESLEVDIKIGNNLNSCVDVSIINILI